MKRVVCVLLATLLLGTGLLSLSGCAKETAKDIELTEIGTHPVEHLVFMTDPGREDEWIEKDTAIWTAYLATSHGFLRKEIWLNEENPGEIHTFIWWASMADWKQFTPEDVTNKDIEFTAALNGLKSDYTDINTVDRHQQLVRVKSIDKVDGELVETFHDNQPIEHLVFMTDPGKEAFWIATDHEVWTKYLASSEGLLRKEVWINEENPGEIHTFIWWNTMEDWKQFSTEDVIENDKIFAEKLDGVKSEYIDIATTDGHQQLVHTHTSFVHEK